MALKKGKTVKKTTKKKVDKKEKIEIMNGDPTVVTPVEEVKIEEEVLEAVSDPIDESGNIAEPLREKQEEEVEYVEQDPPLEKEFEVMNGDPTVVTPKEDEILKMQMEALTATFKENKINKRVDNSIGYSWNGMEMDTY
jgi:hypothetical protein